MKAIYKKELKSYFTSIVACLYIAITILASGIAFIVNNLKNDVANSNNTEFPAMITIMSVVFVVAIPILVMRSFAEERNQKTDQLLLTTPISIGKIIFGKFFAILTIYIIPFIVMCVYPLVLKHYGEINLKLAYANIGGLALYGLVLIAICMFISALTEMQVVAATISAVVIAVTWAIGYFNLTDYISKEGNIFTKIISCFDTFSPLRNMFTGLIDFKDLFFYVSLIFLFLFLTYEAIQKRRWSVSSKNIGVGIFSTLMTVIIIAIVVFSNILVSYVTENKMMLKWDLTANNVYGISNDTKKMLSKLEDNIDIYVLSPKKDLENDKDLKKKYALDVDFSLLTKTLDRYSASSNKINVEYVDLDKNPKFLDDYSVDNLDQQFTKYGLVVSDEKTKKSTGINFYEIYDIQQSGNEQMQQMGMSSLQVVSYDAEGQINSAIAFVQSAKTAKVLFATNHNEIQAQYEMGVNSMFKAFSDHKAETDQINLVKDNLSADKCQALVIFGPQADYSAKETKKVKDYLLDGGHVILALDPDSMKVEKKNLFKLLSDFNIEVDNKLVYDPESNFDDNGYIVLSSEVQGFEKDVSEILSPYSFGITKKDAKNEDDSYLAISSSSDKAFLSSETNDKKTPKYKKGDKKGPFDTIVTISRNLSATESSAVGTDKADSKQAKILVFSTTYGLTDYFSSQAGGDSVKVLDNALDEYLDIGVKTASTEKKAIVNTNIAVPSKKVTIIAWTLVVAIPLIVLVIGVIVWAIRRKR